MKPVPCPALPSNNDPMSRTSIRSTLQSLICLAAATAMVAATGCYKRTVSTKGIGSYGTTGQGSYRPNTKADQWLDSAMSGKPTKTKSKWVGTSK